MRSLLYRHFLGGILFLLAFVLPSCLLYLMSFQCLDHWACSFAGKMWPCGTTSFVEWVIFGYVFLSWVWLPILGGIGYLYRHELLQFIAYHQHRLPLISLIVAVPTLFWFFQICSLTMCLNRSSTLWLAVMIMAAWLSTMWLWLPLLLAYIWLEIIYARYHLRARRLVAS